MSKKKHGKMNAVEEEYMMRYGGIPSDHESLIRYVMDKYPPNARSLKNLLDVIDQIQWKTVEFTLYLIPQPTPRPRIAGGHFYVKGAANNKKLIKKYIEKHIISTRCEISMEAYVPTPLHSMTSTEIYLAECKKIFPIGLPDVDNLMKTYLDMMQGHLLLNDNLVTSCILEKFYSIKPRMVIRIRYQDGYDCRFNARKITNSRLYQEEFSDK